MTIPNLDEAAQVRPPPARARRVSVAIAGMDVCTRRRRRGGEGLMRRRRSLPRSTRSSGAWPREPNTPRAAAHAAGAPVTLRAHRRYMLEAEKRKNLTARAAVVKARPAPVLPVAAGVGAALVGTCALLLQRAGDVPPPA